MTTEPRVENDLHEDNHKQVKPIGPRRRGVDGCADDAAASLDDYLGAESDNAACKAERKSATGIWSFRAGTSVRVQITRPSLTENMTNGATGRYLSASASHRSSATYSWPGAYGEPVGSCTNRTVPSSTACTGEGVKTRRTVAECSAPITHAPLNAQRAGAPDAEIRKWRMVSASLTAQRIPRSTESTFSKHPIERTSATRVTRPAHWRLGVGSLVEVGSWELGVRECVFRVPRARALRRTPPSCCGCRAWG